MNVQFRSGRGCLIFVILVIAVKTMDSRLVGHRTHHHLPKPTHCGYINVHQINARYQPFLFTGKVKVQISFVTPNWCDSPSRRKASGPWRKNKLIWLVSHSKSEHRFWLAGPLKKKEIIIYKTDQTTSQEIFQTLQTGAIDTYDAERYELVGFTVAVTNEKLAELRMIQTHCSRTSFDTDLQTWSAM